MFTEQLTSELKERGGVGVVCEAGWNSGTYHDLAEGQQVSGVNIGTKTLMVTITRKLITEAHFDHFLRVQVKSG